MVKIIKSTDTTLPTDTNLLSALATARRIGAVVSGVNNLIRNLLEQTYTKFLRKDVRDTAEELITFLKGIEVPERSRFEVIEGKLQSAMQSVITTLNEKDNYLKNATFQRDMEGWIRERDIIFHEIGDGLIDLGLNFFSEKNRIADVDSFDGRFLLRIKESYIKQLNADIKEPGEGDGLWVTVKYYCTEPGRLTAGFAGSGLYVNRDIPVSEGGFSQKKMPGTDCRRSVPPLEKRLRQFELRSNRPGSIAPH